MMHVELSASCLNRPCRVFYAWVALPPHSPTPFGHLKPSGQFWKLELKALENKFRLQRTRNQGSGGQNGDSTLRLRNWSSKWSAQGTDHFAVSKLAPAL